MTELEELKAMIEKLSVENKRLQTEIELMQNQALGSFGSKWTGRHWCPPLCGKTEENAE